MIPNVCAPVEERRAVIIPSYNSGGLLAPTVKRVLDVWKPVVVVIDGSTDGSEARVNDLANKEPALHLIALPTNGGKGAAVRAGFEFAAARGWTHAATFDADGQHEAADIPRFMEAAREAPEALIMGDPVFGPDAPRLRVLGHRIANYWSGLETRGAGLGDSLFGFRVYPVEASLELMRQTGGARGFDFETQLAVRLCWCGTPIVRMPTHVRYRSRQQGGVSHFRYLRDNLLLIRVHAKLLTLAWTKRRREALDRSTRVC